MYTEADYSVKELVTKILMVNSRRDGALKQDMVVRGFHYIYMITETH